MAKGHDGIGGFLGRAVRGECFGVELRTRDGVVQAWRLDGETESLVGEIIAAAENDAQGIAGAVRFTIVALHTVEGGVRDWGRHVIVQGGAEDGVDPFASNAGDVSLQAIVGELIRDRREGQRMNQLYTDRLMSRMQQMNDAQTIVAANAEKRHVESLELMEKLLADKEERDARLLKQRAELVRAERAFETFVPMVAAGANKLLAAASGNPTILADEVFEKFIESIDEGEALAILGAIKDPRKQATLMALFQSFQERKALREKKSGEERAHVENALSNGVSPGEITK